MSRRIITVTSFLIFNVFFFAVYLSCIHRSKADLATQPAVSPFNAAFSEPPGKTGQTHTPAPKPLPIPAVNKQ